MATSPVRTTLLIYLAAACALALSGYFTDRPNLIAAAIAVAVCASILAVLHPAEIKKMLKSLSQTKPKKPVATTQ